MEKKKEKKEPKQSHSIRINQELWERARFSGIPMTEAFELTLKLMTNRAKYFLYRNICYCNWCKQQKDIHEILTLHSYHNGKSFLDSKELSICYGCIDEIKAATTFDRYDEPIAIMLFVKIKSNEFNIGTTEDLLDRFGLLTEDTEYRKQHPEKWDLYKHGKGYHTPPPLKLSADPEMWGEEELKEAIKSEENIIITDVKVLLPILKGLLSEKPIEDNENIG